MTAILAAVVFAVVAVVVATCAIGSSARAAGRTRVDEACRTVFAWAMAALVVGSAALSAAVIVASRT